MLSSRRDDGFTLIELVVSMAVLGIVMLGLVGVMFGSISTNVQTKVRLDETRDQQFAAAYFGTDAQAATAILTPVGVPPTLPLATCGPGRAAIEFQGTSYDATSYAATVTVVSYVFETATVDGKPAGRLQRQSCEVAAADMASGPLTIDSATIVARNLTTAPPVSTCAPTPCSPTSTSVTLTMARRSGDTAFVLVGTRRTT